MKFSLLSLLGAVLIAALGCAALAHPVGASAMAVFSTTVVLFSVALIALIYCTAAAKAFWSGFAILGWLYLLLVWICIPGELAPNTNGQMLATSWMLSKLGNATIESPKALQTVSYPALAALPSTAAYSDPTPIVQPNAPVYSPYAPGQAPRRYAPGSRQVAYTFPDLDAWSSFLRIGHSLCALLAAFGGGVLARALYLRRERRAVQAL